MEREAVNAGEIQDWFDGDSYHGEIADVGGGSAEDTEQIAGPWEVKPAAMTDYLGEQEGEIEALQSIYVDDEFQLISPKTFVINLAVEQDHHNTDQENAVRLECRFTYPETYPESPVEYSVVERVRPDSPKNDGDDGDDGTDEDNADNEDEREGALGNEDTHDVLGEKLVDLFALFDQQIEENLGEAVVFTLVSSAKDWLDETVVAIRTERIKREDEAERAKVEVVIDGTPCTEENFNEWKSTFDEEMRKEGRLGFVEITHKAGKTGVELFMADRTLAESDLKIESATNTEQDAVAGP